MSTATATVDDTVDEVAARFRDRAARVDSGDQQVVDGLRWLGERDLIAPRGGGLPYAVSLVERIAGECMSSAFSLWAQRMVIEYLGRGEPDSGELLGELLAGRVVGSTAMAPALADVAGLGPVPVTARRADGGLRLTGPIRWASNLFPDAVVVLPVRVGDGADRAVVRLRLSDPGVQVDPRPELLALNGTASSSALLRDVHVPGDAVLSWDLRAFVGSIRPTFLLVQSAFCSGLAQRSTEETKRHLTGPNAELTGEAELVAARAASVHRRLHAGAADAASLSSAELLSLRLDAAAAASAATRLEATVRGGAGYLAGSDVSRRLREGAFLPIQAPTEGQLRWELSRSV
ncbi:acyl-CoA dehydrogenase family protein [Pseudonocardia spinosispora]|uniref:acyl-CoA dehydrogenase family protein n=1 Tax=Pseudonocardia spinosispora TaxID=103441 RepID=UPI0004085008|nr:acyl-CoA dehydrogenase family protein [Pseudonocardia spinosispora]